MWRRGAVLFIVALFVLAAFVLSLAAGTPRSTQHSYEDWERLRREMQPAFRLPPPVLSPLAAVGSMTQLQRLLGPKRAETLAAMPALRPFLALFDGMFELHAKPAQLVLPAEFMDKARRMFAAYPSGAGDVASHIQSQSIVTAYNRYTEEYSMFNELRRFRPGYAERPSPEAERELAAAIEASSGTERCDFCRGGDAATARDVFGRVESRHAYTASNIAKYEQWHGLVIARTHSPLAFDHAAIADYVETSREWFRRAHAADPRAEYPHVMWDANKRASASQVHLHWQLILTHSRYMMRAEQQRRAAEHYAAANRRRNYWSDFIAVHEALGLAVRAGDAAVVSHVCPVKERELLVIAPRSDVHFSRALAVALIALRDDTGSRAFSVGMTFEPLGADGRGIADGSSPVVARIIDRGAPSDLRSDVGAMEFFGANNVGWDPYLIVDALRRRVSEALKNPGNVTAK